MNQALFWKIAGSVIGIGVVAGLFFAILGWPAGIPFYMGALVGGFVAAAGGLMGLWAFLLLNYIFRSFLPFRVWMWFQGVLVGFAIFDVLFYFPQVASLLPSGLALAPGNYLVYLLSPFVYAVLVGLVKAYKTNWEAFLPSVFFMSVFTAVEWLPAVVNARQWNVAGLIWIVLSICNTYLLFTMGKTQPMVRRQSVVIQPKS
nr:hypothetical protein [Bacilli bacterium]